VKTNISRNAVSSIALVCIASSAHAQNSVTLYGIVDSGFAYISNIGGHNSFQQVSSQMAGNRWGLLGSEDLGGGLATVFRLENGFNLSNGKLSQNGREFGRQAYVGVSDTHLGTITLGRQYPVNTNGLANLSLGTLGAGALARHPYDNDNLGTSVIFDNSVKFQSVTYRGFNFGGLYGFSNNAGHFTAGRVIDFGASYVFEGLTAAVSFTESNDTGSSNDTSGSIATADAQFLAARQRTWGAGANYAFGRATVGAVYTQTQLSNVTAITAGFAGTSSNVPVSGGSARFANYEVNGTYRFTPAFTVFGGYTLTDAHLDGVTPKYHQITFGGDYAVSKRTDLYAVATYQHVNDTGNSGITARIVGTSSSSTRSQAEVVLDLRHRF
jgi:general bacterial porin, GBP family